MKSKVQAIYDYVFKLLQEQFGVENVYPKLPMQEVPYPFATIEVANANTVDHKTGNFIETIELSVDLWGDNTQRWELYNALLAVKNSLNKQDMNVHASSKLIDDYSTGTLLYHEACSFVIQF